MTAILSHDLSYVGVKGVRGVSAWTVDRNLMIVTMDCPFVPWCLGIAERGGGGGKGGCSPLCIMILKGIDVYYRGSKLHFGGWGG